MEEMHRTHKENAWGWVGVLEDLRRSRSRQRLRRNGPRRSSWDARVLPRWTD